MNVRRGFLYAGVFLLAAGGVLLLAQAGTIDESAVTAALSLWPLAVIAIGIGLLARRTRLAVPAGMVAAALPGLVFGGMVVAVPDLPDIATWSTPCGEAKAADTVTGRQGTFGTAASVDLSLACGELTVTTGPGAGWQLDTADGPGAGAVVSDATDHLSIRSVDRKRSLSSVTRSDSWRLILPTDPMLGLAAEISAGKATVDLAGARLGTVSLAVNAGDAMVDLDGATVSRLSLTANAAKATVRLPATGDLSADIRVNAGSVVVCAPADLGLRVRGDSSLAATTYNGLVRSGDTWRSPADAIARYHADVTISANVGSVVVNPKGGCS